MSKTRTQNEDDDENGYQSKDMLRLLRTLTPGLVALCHLGVTQATPQAAPPAANTKQAKKAAYSSKEDRVAKKSTRHDGLEKKVLTATAYDLWQSISDPILSDDGVWISYTISSGSGAADLIVRSTRGATEFRIPRKAVPQSTRLDQSEARKWNQLLKHKTLAQFSADSKSIVFAILPTEQETATVDLESVTLGVLRLPEGAITKIPNVSSFALPRNSGSYVGYTLARDGAKSRPHDLEKTERGRTLVVRSIAADTETRIPDVTEFTFDDTATYVAYAVSSDNEHTNGTYVRKLVGGAAAIPLQKGPGRYRGLAIDTKGRQLAFLSDQRGRMTGSPEYTLYYARLAYEADPVVSRAILPDNFVLSQDSRVEFTRSGEALTFEVGLPTVMPPPVENEPEFELWTYKDVRPIPRGARAQPAHGSKSLTVYHIASRRCVRLSGKNVQLTEDARYATTLDRSPYELSQWKQGGFRADAYILDVLTGKSRLFRRGWDPSWFLSRAMNQSGYRFTQIDLSPRGQYIAYFENQRWFSYNLEREKIVDLMGSLPSIMPNSLATVAGWSIADRRVLIYDEHDVWLIDPSGRDAPNNLTQGIRHDNDNITFRLWDDATLVTMYGDFRSQHLRRPEPAIDTFQPLLFIAYDRRSGGSSVWRISVEARTPVEKLFEVDKRILPVAKAKNAQQHLFTMQTFNEFPDLWTTSRFDQVEKISHANPQQKQYRWGTEEPFESLNREGVPIKGVLYKPEGFDSSAKYPMIVGLYPSLPYEVPFGHYRSPVPLTGAYTRYDSPARFVSNGYVVFHPEVAYSTPFVYAGQSALNSVVPAVQAVIDRGFVDPARIAVTGHSFGGYHTAFIVTQTNLFRCAVIGAGIFNLISNYGADVGTGKPAFFESMHGGMNFGASIWQNPFAYHMNSPLFFADRIKTPLLLLHNDGETVVPFSQAVEFVTALRRNDKEAYLFNYTGEDHALRKHANVVDWDARMHEFLDYHLKDAPRPSWLSP